jgi:hypothetical protein
MDDVVASIFNFPEVNEYGKLGLTQSNHGGIKKIGLSPSGG